MGSEEQQTASIDESRNSFSGEKSKALDAEPEDSKILNIVGTSYVQIDVNPDEATNPCR